MRVENVGLYFRKTIVAKLDLSRKKCRSLFATHTFARSVWYSISTDFKKRQEPRNNTPNQDNLRWGQANVVHNAHERELQNSGENGPKKKKLDQTMMPTQFNGAATNRVAKI